MNVGVKSMLYLLVLSPILRISPMSVTGTQGHHLALREGRWQVNVLHNTAVSAAVHCGPGAHQPVAEHLVI